MGKMSFFIILVLSVVVTYLLPYLNLFFPVSGGGFGFPIKYGTSSFFGGSSFEFALFLSDAVFWFLVILVIWKTIQKLLKR